MTINNLHFTFLDIDYNKVKIDYDKNLFIFNGNNVNASIDADY